MEAAFFTSSFEDILKLSKSEGPTYNVFEPKFTSRRQMQQLLEAVENAYRSKRSWLAVRQMCRCLTFLGTTNIEVEEEDEGILEIRKAYALLQLCAAEAEDSLPEDPLAIEPIALDTILSANEPFLQRDRHYAGCVEFLRVHNAAGLYLNMQGRDRGASDARKVLVLAEEAYKEWSEWYSQQPGAKMTQELPVGDDGRIDMGRLEGDEAARALLMQRFEMDCAYTSTLFFLAQVCTVLQDVSPACRYCHLTMYYQLLCRQEFDRKEWAGNALQLSGFYSSHGAYGQALHCLRAGERIMPAENPDETTRGIVLWAYGRFYINRLVYYGNERRAPARVGPRQEDFTSYWVDFPVAEIEPVTEMAAVQTFEDAREEFKKGNKVLQEALAFHPFDISCTSHIDIVQDMSKLYAALELFEDNRSRRIAMLQRRVTLIEGFPDKLSFNAYPIVVRQLLYDLGNLTDDMIRLRQEQRRSPLSGEKPLKDGPLNALVTCAKQYYTRFVETWRSPTTGEIPAVLDEDSRLPFFRVLMRLAHLETCFAFPLPKDEFDGIGRAKDAYQRAVEFAENNKPITADVTNLIEKEVSLAKEMVQLLPDKQRNVWAAYQRSLRS